MINVHSFFLHVIFSQFAYHDALYQFLQTGIGTEHTFRLTDRMNIFADVAYQVSTSGFLDDRFYTGNTGPNSNGWFDINIGVQYNLGRSSGKFVRAE